MNITLDLTDAQVASLKAQLGGVTPPVPGPTPTPVPPAPPGPPVDPTVTPNPKPIADDGLHFNFMDPKDWQDNAHNYLMQKKGPSYAWNLTRNTLARSDWPFMGVNGTEAAKIKQTWSAGGESTNYYPDVPKYKVKFITYKKEENFVLVYAMDPNGTVIIPIQPGPNPKTATYTLMGKFAK